MLPENHYGYNIRDNFQAALSLLDNATTRQILRSCLQRPQIITNTYDIDLYDEMSERLLPDKSILPKWLKYPEFLYELVRPVSVDFMLSLISHLQMSAPGLIGAMAESVNYINEPEIYSAADLIGPDAIDKLAYDFSERNTGLNNATIPLIGIATAAGQPIEEHLNPFYFVHAGILKATDQVGSSFGSPAANAPEFLQRMQSLFTPSVTEQPAWDILTTNGAFTNRVGCPMQRWTRSFYKIYGEELAGEYGALMLSRIGK